MKNSLYDRRHWNEYLAYGLVAGILCIFPSRIFLAMGDYNYTYIVFPGSIIFMFITSCITFINCLAGAQDIKMPG